MLPFAIAPYPEAYSGKHIWFTLRFVEPVTTVPNIPIGDFVWSPNQRSEWIDGEQLAIGDWQLDGQIVARVDIGGQPCWKIEVGPKATRMIPIASLVGKRVERIVRQDPRRGTIEWDGEPADFDITKLDRALERIHARYPLLAVLFQDGTWFDGESLADLDDVTLVARLAAPRRSTTDDPPTKPAKKRKTKSRQDGR